MNVAKRMVSSSHRCDLLRRFEAAAYQVANKPETMEESDEEDSAHVGVGNIFKDESFLSARTNRKFYQGQYGNR